MTTAHEAPQCLTLRYRITSACSAVAGALFWAGFLILCVLATTIAVTGYEIIFRPLEMPFRYPAMTRAAMAFASWLGDWWYLDVLGLLGGIVTVVLVPMVARSQRTVFVFRLIGPVSFAMVALLLALLIVCLLQPMLEVIRLSHSTVGG